MTKRVIFLAAILFTVFFGGFALAANYMDIKTGQLKALLDKRKDVVMIFPLSKIEFNDSHIVGSFNIPLEQLEKKLPSNKEQCLVFYCLGEKCTGSWRAAEIASKLGYKNVFAYREGLPAWAAAGYPTTSSEALPNVKVDNITTDQLQAELDSDMDLVLLDINLRTDAERFHVDSPKRVHIPMEELQDNLSKLSKDKRIAVLCLKGARSKSAVRYLIGKGFKNVVNVDGGIEKWIAENKPVVRAVQKVAQN